MPLVVRAQERNNFFSQPALALELPFQANIAPKSADQPNPAPEMETARRCFKILDVGLLL